MMGRRDDVEIASEVADEDAFIPSFAERFRKEAVDGPLGVAWSLTSAEASGGAIGAEVKPAVREMCGEQMDGP